MSKNLFSFFAGFILSMAFLSANANAANKYDEAVKLFDKFIDDQRWENLLKGNQYCSSDIYESAMSLSGATIFRRYALTTWVMHVFGSDTTIELHHIAGDMLHIINLAKDDYYKRKIESAMKQEYLENWSNNLKYFDYLKSFESPTNIPIEGQNTDIDMCDAFIKMIKLFKIYEEEGEESFLRCAYSEYNKKRNCYSYEPYS